MVKIRFIGVSSALLLVGLSTIALAQTIPAALQCKPTETQPECHARLKCKAYEELEDCQKRLAKERSAAQNNGAQNNGGQRDDGNNRGDDRGGDDRSDDRGDRGDNDRGDNDRGDNDRGDSDRGDNGRRSRGGDRDGGGRRRRGHRSGGKSFEANKTFGLGLELGEPTGLNGKYFLSKAGALDFGVGWIYRHYYYGDGFHVYGDYLFHPVSLISSAAFELPFYVGIGLRYWDFHYCFQGNCDYGGSAVGIRIPLGIAFDFNNSPLDIFFQLVPTIDFINGDYYDRYHDRNHFGVDFSFGIRYWFK